MNFQAIICSFILGVGLVLICTSTGTVDEDTNFTKTTCKIIFIIGCVMTAIGGLAYVYTIHEVLVRAREKFRAKKLRKLEQQNAQLKTVSIRIEGEKNVPA